LIALLVFAVARQDLPQFAGKAVTARAIFYPIAALVVPVAWLFARRRRSVEYPYALDILIALPFLIDTAGNAANLYDAIDSWDDVNHFVNWAILVAGFSQLLLRLRLGTLNAIADSVAPSPPRCSASGSPGALLDGDGLRQVPRLVDVQPPQARDPVGEQLQR
jgi:hypothetical protein